MDRALGLDDTRRQDWIAGGEVSVYVHPALKVGATAVNIRPRRQDDSYAWSWLAGLDLAPAFTSAGWERAYGSLYTEFGRREGATREGHGRYLAGNLGVGTLGISVEYKDYVNFNLLANDPPPLVREHSAYLLNRNTHVLETFIEKGFQVEAIYAVPDWMTVTANMSHAENELSPTLTTRFDERFISVDVEALPEGRKLSLFVDWGRDELDGRSDLRTAGLLVGATTEAQHSLDFDLQFQRGRLNLVDLPTYWDAYTALSYQSPIGLGAAITLNRTSDPLETDRPETFSLVENDPATFWSLNLSARSGRFDGLLFIGERRGGTACTSGTCYEVLAFKGTEFRLTTRF